MLFFFSESADNQDLHVLTHSSPKLRSSDLGSWQIIVRRILEIIAGENKLVVGHWAHDSVADLAGMFAEQSGELIRRLAESRIALMRSHMLEQQSFDAEFLCCADQIGRASCRERVCQYV